MEREQKESWRHVCDHKSPHVLGGQSTAKQGKTQQGGRGIDSNEVAHFDKRVMFSVKHPQNEM